MDPNRPWPSTTVSGRFERCRFCLGPTRSRDDARIVSDISNDLETSFPQLPKWLVLIQPRDQSSSPIGDISPRAPAAVIAVGLDDVGEFDGWTARNERAAVPIESLSLGDVLARPFQLVPVTIPPGAVAEYAEGARSAQL